MKVVALRQLYGSYGLAAAGDMFEVEDSAAADMRKRNLVCLPDDYEKKVTLLSKTGRARETKKKPGVEVKQMPIPVSQPAAQQNLLTAGQPDGAEDSK